MPQGRGHVHHVCHEDVTVTLSDVMGTRYVHFMSRFLVSQSRISLKLRRRDY